MDCFYLSGPVPKSPQICLREQRICSKVYRSIWRSNGSVPKCQWMYSIEGLNGPVPKCPQTYASVNRSYLFNRAMNLSQSLHGSILFKEAMGLPQNDLGLFSFLFLFCFENAMAMFRRVHGVTPEREWPPALKNFYSFFCFEDTIALFKSVLGPFLLLFLFLFWGCNGPVPKCPWSYSRKSMTSSSSRCLACLWAQRCSMTEAEIRHFSWNICFLSAGQNLLAENKKTPGYSAEIISNLMNI